MSQNLDYGPVKRLDLLNIFPFPVTASQLFHPRGGHIVYLDANGRMTLALTATTTLYGWCFAPRSFEVGSTAASNGYWTSSSTEGGSVLPVAPFACNPGMVFKLPCTAGGGLAVAARCGETSDIVAVNDGTAQYATPATTSTDVLLFIALDPDGDTNSALFVVNPAKVQADT